MRKRIVRQVFAVHRSHCQIYSRYRRFRLTTRFILFFLLAVVSDWRARPSSDQQGRWRGRGGGGRRRKWRYGPASQGFKDWKRKKKTLKCTCQKKNNYAYRQQETKQHLFAIRHISTSQGRRTNLASQGNNNNVICFVFSSPISLRNNWQLISLCQRLRGARRKKGDM